MEVSNLIETYLLVGIPSVIKFECHTGPSVIDPFTCSCAQALDQCLYHNSVWNLFLFYYGLNSYLKTKILLQLHHNFRQNPCFVPNCFTLHADFSFICDIYIYQECIITSMNSCINQLLITVSLTTSHQ